MLDVPAQDHLRHRPPRARRRVADRGRVEAVAAAQGGPALRDDAKLLVHRPHALLRQRRVQLDLVQRGRDARLVDQATQMRLVEVRDADGPHAPFVAQADQRLPAVDIGVHRRQRPVDQVQVQIIQSRPLHRRVKGPQRGVMPLRIVPQLGRDEDLVADHVAVADAPAHPGLVLVGGGTVDQPVSDAQRLGHDLGGLRILDLPDAGAQLGHGPAVVQGHHGLGHRGFLSDVASQRPGPAAGFMRQNHRSVRRSRPAAGRARWQRRAAGCPPPPRPARIRPGAGPGRP